MRKLSGIGLLLLALFSCQHLNSLRSDKTLTEKIESEFKSESNIIDLSQLNSFEWNELLILGPYSVVGNVEEELNLDLENIREKIRHNNWQKHSILFFIFDIKIL